MYLENINCAIPVKKNYPSWKYSQLHAIPVKLYVTFRFRPDYQKGPDVVPEQAEYSPGILQYLREATGDKTDHSSTRYEGEDVYVFTHTDPLHLI